MSLAKSDKWTKLQIAQWKYLAVESEGFLSILSCMVLTARLSKLWIIFEGNNLQSTSYSHSRVLWSCLSSQMVYLIVITNQWWNGSAENSNKLNFRSFNRYYLQSMKNEEILMSKTEDTGSIPGWSLGYWSLDQPPE